MENLEGDSLMLKIDAYLKKRLSDKEMTAFTQEIAVNKVLTQQVERQKVHLQAIDILLEDDLRTKMKHWESEEIDNKPNTFNWKNWGLGLIAIAVLASLYVIFKSKNNAINSANSVKNQPDSVLIKTQQIRPIKVIAPPIKPQLEEKKTPIVLNEKTTKIKTNEVIVEVSKPSLNAPSVATQTLPNDVLITANEELILTLNEFEKNTRTRGTDTLMSESYALLNQKEYSKALNLLKNAPNTEGVFPTAIAYFLNKQYAEALPIFERLTNDGFYKADLTNYYAALCVLANGQKDAAIKRFTTIANDKENEYSDKALLVLKRFGY